MMRCFLSIANINKIGLCMMGLEIHFHYLIYHIGLEYFNISRIILYIEKSVIGQVIICTRAKRLEKEI